MTSESSNDSSTKNQSVSSTSSSSSSSPAKVSLAVLTALVIGSMIGGGIFNLPKQMGAAAAPGPLIIGWLITGAGMLMLAKVFQGLAVQRPDIDAGVYGYAKEGFGNYLGFSSAWGYWVSAWMGNVGYLVFLMTAIGVFLPGFGEGTTVLATVISSVLLWLYHLLIMRGIRETAVLNVVVTVAKVVPLIVFIVIGAIAFKLDTFTADFWGSGSGLGTTLTQVKAMMLVTVWVFIGVEGASVFSERARDRRDVGRATITGFASVLALLLLVNLLSYGIAPREKIAELDDPSMSGVLTEAVGPWGAKFIAAGLAISLIGALLSWFLMCAEILRVPALDGTMPRWFSRENKNGTPVGAMWLTTGMVQVVLIWTHFVGSNYTRLILLASALILIPYLFSAAFHLINSFRNREGNGIGNIIIGALGTTYAIWLLYAAGPTYLLFVGLFYLAGTPFYVVARKQVGEKIFTTIDWIVLAIFSLISIYAIYGLYMGFYTDALSG